MGSTNTSSSRSLLCQVPRKGRSFHDVKAQQTQWGKWGRVGPRVQVFSSGARAGKSCIVIEIKSMHRSSRKKPGRERKEARACMGVEQRVRD